MKRNHIYVGGTVLLALLGACGGYYVWAGSGEKESDPDQALGAGATSGDDDDSILPIDVPPMASDDVFPPPIAQESTDRPPRYAMNPGSPDSGSTYPPYPAAGGASPLPASPDPNQEPLAPALQSLPADGAESATQPNPLGGRYDSNYSAAVPLGNEIDGVNSAVEVESPAGTATDLYAVPHVSALPAEANAAAQDSESAAVAGDGGFGNALRESAREAFATDPVGSGADGATGRYDDAAISANPADESYGGIGAPTPQASQPAPITIAESAEPLGGSSTTAYPSNTGEPSYANGGTGIADFAQPDYAADSRAPLGNGTELEVANDGGYAQAAQPSDGANYSGSYGSRNYGGVGDYNSSEPQVSSAFGGGYNANPMPQDSRVGTPSYSGRAGGDLAGGGEGTGRPGAEVLEGPQAPQLSVEKTAPAEIQVGKNCTFTLVVRNTGSAEARQVRLVDEVPLGTQLVKTSPNAAIAGSRLEWEFGTLAPGDSKSVEVELLPTNEGEIGSVATVHFAAAASVRTHSTRPQLEVVAQVSPTVMIGEQQVVRIAIKNPGTGDATGVMLLENVPAGMSHPHGPDLEFEVGTLRAGESRELELVLTAEAKGVFQNRIVATGDANLYAEDLAQFEVVAPEIAVSVVGPQRKYLELPAEFVVAVENRGTAAAKDIELVGKLPQGLEFVSANNFGEYDEATRSVYWSLAELQPSKRGEVTLIAKPVDLGEKRLEFKAGAELGLVDHAESMLQVEGLAALKSEVTDVADPIEVDGQTSYEIRIVNQGSKAATNVIVVAHFPEGIDAVRAEGPTEGRVEPKRVQFAPLRELSPKADTTYRIDVAGVSPGDQRVLVQIMTNDLAQPINVEESTCVYSDQ